MGGHQAVGQPRGPHRRQALGSQQGPSSRLAPRPLRIGVADQLQPIGGDPGRLLGQELTQTDAQLLVIESVADQELMESTHRLKQGSGQQHLALASLPATAKGAGTTRHRQLGRAWVKSG